VAVGTNSTGQSGADGTIFFGLNNAGLADQWLTEETGIIAPSPGDWLVDYDGDGIDARLEYAFGGSTSSSDSSLLPEIVSDDAGGYNIIFNRRQNGIDISDYTVETSTTLAPGDWGALGTEESRTVSHPTLGGFDQVVAPLLPDSPRRFIRLKIR
ncbi:hypothetical protein N9192_00155, partial [Akkermansiaceae bacterium]|nr:hypothetical protein [Akkermansiaceae bacterium]